ncbi:MAG: DUF4430 domain-containing protein [Ruminococcaceae bacterium]|nr:DUF4430 domain-containing protein [Oscillospiraceae bacterium]
MKMTHLKKLLSCFLCLVLIAATALTATACNDIFKNLLPKEEESTSSTQETETPAPKKNFTFIVVDKDGKETSFSISTDKTTVGDALLAEGLIEGENGAYGLYVKKVNGITADYDTDKTYWAFYINGEYAMTGVDATEIVEGATYSFKVEK